MNVMKIRKRRKRRKRRINHDRCTHFNINPIQLISTTYTPMTYTTHTLSHTHTHTRTHTHAGNVKNVTKSYLRCTEGEAEDGPFERLLKVAPEHTEWCELIRMLLHQRVFVLDTG